MELMLFCGFGVATLLDLLAFGYPHFDALRMFVLRVYSIVNSDDILAFNDGSK